VPTTVADHLQDPRHAAPLAGADRIGQASADGRTVQVGLWLERGAVVRARFLASSCASLIAYAEVACALLEAGLPPAALDAAALRSELAGVHPAHLCRAELVAAATQAAAGG
jgi:NifU-like protein involved in Fe-S cluster formation